LNLFTGFEQHLAGCNPQIIGSPIGYVDPFKRFPDIAGQCGEVAHGALPAPAAELVSEDSSRRSSPAFGTSSRFPILIAGSSPDLIAS
jgi:hypothetical protein